MNNFSLSLERRRSISFSFFSFKERADLHKRSSDHSALKEPLTGGRIKCITEWNYVVNDREG